MKRFIMNRYLFVNFEFQAQKCGCLIVPNAIAIFIYYNDKKALEVISKKRVIKI